MRTGRLSVAFATSTVTIACAAPAPEPVVPRVAAPAHAILPHPAAVAFTAGAAFVVTDSTAVYVTSTAPDVVRVGEVLARLIAATPQATLPVRDAVDGVRPGGIVLQLEAAGPAPGGVGARGDWPGQALLGAEGYLLDVSSDVALIRASTAAGLFYGVQTLRQLMPPRLEYHAALRRGRPLTVPAVRVVDRPRFEWRGAMLDVARHFHPPEHVKRYIDLLALHKLNRLHLHLADDQGWRIDIASWPNLAAYGGSSGVGGSAGGYYTQQEYADIVAYARDRFITVVPEIDMPGHTNAALASYPELNCDGVAPPLYLGIEVGFSTLCVDADITYRFVDDVLRELAMLTPGPYLHIGGDEVEKLSAAQYRTFIERVQDIVRSHGKRMVGWQEIGAARLDSTSIVQYWNPGLPVPDAVSSGAPVILSPANRVYLDMKYDSTTALGLNWAGYVELRDTYDWDPATLLDVAPRRILGVEAPLWSETVATLSDLEYMAFPRLAAVAELAWSPQQLRSWQEFRKRVGAQAPRWQALGINFYRSRQVEWR